MNEISSKPTEQTNTEEKKTPTLIPSAPLLDRKPWESKKIKITEKTSENLMKAAMVEPVNEAQITMPTLEKYSKKQIKEMFQDILKNPPSFHFKAEIPFKPEFTVDEDIALLNYIRLYEKDGLEKFLKSNQHMFRPCRSLAEIKERVEILSKMSDKEKEEIIEKQVNQIITEELYFLSTDKETEEEKKLGLSPESFVTSRCFYEPYHQPPVRNPNVDQQIEEYKKMLPIVNDKYFSNKCLAILRTEKTIYLMKREAITLGRESIDYDVDVDLSFENEKTCIHTSRVQAILSFLPDLNFYLENIGNRGFRVNGELIPPGDICKINEGDILDFSGVLLLFIPNTRLIDDIRRKLDEPEPQQQNTM